MPDEKPISGLTSAPDVDENTLVEVAVEDQSAPSHYASYQGALGFIFDKILNGTIFNERLKTVVKTVFGAINEVAEDHNVADQFSTSSTYAVGDYVIYGGTLYKCITAVTTAGAWDSTKWTAVVVTDEMGGGGGSANMTELTQAEYDALEQAGQLEEDMMYFITDGQSGGGVVIDDSTTSASKVWSSQKTDSEIQSVASDVATKQDDLSCGQLANVDLNNYKTTGNYWVTQTGISNKPTSNFGFLEVIKVSSTSTLQRFTCYGNDTLATRGEMYVRFFTNNQWYSWNKIAQLIT